jgi:hypothetical protein
MAEMVRALAGDSTMTRGFAELGRPLARLFLGVGMGQVE